MLIFSKISTWFKNYQKRLELEANCKVCTSVRASGVNIGVPHDCTGHQY